MLLSLVLLLAWMPASVAEEEFGGEEEDLLIPVKKEMELTEDGIPGELIVGHPTITKGDFFTEMFGNNTSDIDVRALIHGYNLVNWDQNQGTYVFDPSVVRSASVQIDDRGNKIYTLTLADNLFYSDGTPITGWDYAFSILLMMSPEIEEIGGKIYRCEHLMGSKRYIASRRKVIAGEPLDLSEDSEDIDYLSGVTVLDEGRQLRFFLDDDFLPYFFEIGLMLTVPYPISVIAPGVKVEAGYVDPETGDSIGIKLVNADGSDTPVYTADLLRKTILDPVEGYNSHPKVVSGPYLLDSWDPETHVGHFSINEYFKGAWVENNLPGEDIGAALQKALDHGHAYAETDEFGNQLLDGSEKPIYLVKPTIEHVQLQVADYETVVEKVENQELHLINKVTLAEAIDNLRMTAYNNTPYPRIGMAFLTFSYEKDTVNDELVRQAIAWCMDRDALGQKYCGAYAWVLDGYFGLEQWEYQILEGFVDYPVNQLKSIDEIGTEITEEELTERAKRKKSFMAWETEEERIALYAMWDQLRARWKDDEGNTLLVHYNVQLEEAARLLNKAGWTLNREGNPYDPAVDDVRCKNIKGEIVPLDLSIMYPAGNKMAEFMQEEGMFVDNLAQVGIKVTFVPEEMEKLLQYYYRELPRTTDMIYLATNFHVIVDPSITYSADDTPGHLIWNNTYSDDEKLWKFAVNMRETEPGNSYEYVSEWMDFQERYNEILPAIPVYSNIYYDFYTPYLQNYNITNSVTWSQAILLAYFGLPEAEPAEEEVEVGEDEEVFE